MNIIAIVLLAIVVTSLTFQCLIRKNIIKPNKISRIFYDDDEIFINSWRKTQEKGMLKYIIKNTIYIIVSMGIIFKLATLYKPQNHSPFEYLLIGIISSLMSSISWSDNQNKYNRLKEKGNLENQNVNNSDKKN